MPLIGGFFVSFVLSPVSFVPPASSQTTGRQVSIVRKKSNAQGPTLRKPRTRVPVLDCCVRVLLER